MKSIRYKSGNIQVPCHTFTDGTRTIVLYGVCHVAERSFWELSNNRIQSFESQGYQIHYESIANDMDPAPDLGVDYETFASLANLAGQKSSLDIGSSWLRTDITTSQLLAESDLARMEAKGQQLRESFEAIKEIPNRALVAKLMRVLMKFVLVISRHIPQGATSGIPKSILLHQRNSVAVSAALRAGGDVVAIWGAAHLPGISKGLKGHGFKLAATSWTTVIA